MQRYPINLFHSLGRSSLIHIGFYIPSIIHISYIIMRTFKLLLLALAVISSASARLLISQVTRNRHANHTLARSAEIARSAPSPPPSQRTNSNPNMSSPGVHTRDNIGNSLEGVHNVNERCLCNAVEFDALANTKSGVGSALDHTMVYRDGGAS